MKTVKEIKNQVIELLKLMENVQNINELERLKEDKILKKYTKDKVKYPSLPFKIASKEIKVLKENGWLSKDNQLIISKFKTASTIEKLLVSLIWKNGDLRKIAKIVDGVEESKVVKDRERITFIKFGEFLQDPTTKIIIDQHVIRAFEFIRNLENPRADLEKIRKKKVLYGRDKKILVDYVDWIKNNKIIRSNIKCHSKYTEIIDDLLFGLGKMIK